MSRSKYKSPFGGGQYYTQALFQEQAIRVNVEDRPIKPPFTLLEDRDGFICFRTTFVELEDPTGYKWAIEYLGDWLHWQKLLQCAWFVEAYEFVLKELDNKLKSNALVKIKAISETDGPQALAAAKYLASGDWKPNARRGRPTKAEVQGELKRQIETVEAEDEDIKRIGLRVIK